MNPFYLFELSQLSAFSLCSLSTRDEQEKMDVSAVVAIGLAIQKIWDPPKNTGCVVTIVTFYLLWSMVPKNIYVPILAKEKARKSMRKTH